MHSFFLTAEMLIILKRQWELRQNGPHFDAFVQCRTRYGEGIFVCLCLCVFVQRIRIRKNDIPEVEVFEAIIFDLMCGSKHHSAFCNMV